MPKITGAYKSLVRGVSQQVAQDRLEGQHWEQVNMISDPIRGLTRRRGSAFRAEKNLFSSQPNSQTYEDFSTFKECSFYFQGEEYCVLYRTMDWSEAGTVPNGPPIICYNKDRGEFLDVVSTPACDPILLSGISSATNVGQYALFSSRKFTPSVDDVDKLEETSDKAVAWVRSGEYSRTYRLRITTPLQEEWVEYTTMTSYYDEPLDTTDIPVLDEHGEVRDEYQKEVNDRVNEYNGLVNQHLAESNASIQPQNIALKLKEAAEAQFPEINVEIANTVITFDGATALIADDAGDGTAMVATGNSVDDLDKLTKIHWVGKTVKVLITDSDPYYVRAEATVDGDTGFTEVIWREAAGREYTPNFLFLIAAIRGGTLYVGANPEDLQDLLDAEVGGDDEVPVFLSSVAGDGDSAPLPEIFERPINYLGIFQDRLVMVAGATVFMSRSGDYFNLFRRSVLTIDPDDPVEIYALGAEDDYIRAGSMIDRNFVLFGDRQQYYVNGREPMTPQNAYIAVMSAYDGATSATPQGLGSLLFFTQYRGGRTSVMQMQTGDFSDTLDAFSITQQISTYIQGQPVQILTASNPQNVIIRTDGYSHGFYVYTYLDAPGQQQRYFDSWSRWEWNEALGTMIGITGRDNQVIVFTLRERANGYSVVADEFSRDADPDDVPCLDSWRVGEGAEDNVAHPEVYSAVLPGGHQRQYFGLPLSEKDSLLEYSGVNEADVYVGAAFEAFYEPTSPYRRDRDDTAILDGRLTLSSLLISVENSGAFTVDLWRTGNPNDLTRILDLTNWRLNDSRVQLGAVPVRDGQHRVYIGREIREHRLRISAKLWLPLTLTTIEWEGQVFSRRR